jgi:hypothetical protein
MQTTATGKEIHLINRRDSSAETHTTVSFRSCFGPGRALGRIGREFKAQALRDRGHRAVLSIVRPDMPRRLNLFFHAPYHGH